MTRSPPSRVVVLALAGMVAATLAACSGGSPSADRSTALPTPSRAAAVPGRALEERVHDLLAAEAVAVDEDLQTGGREQEVRLTWGAHGSVVDASSLPIGTSARTGPRSSAARSHSCSVRPAARPTRAGPSVAPRPPGSPAR
jgi:hypothetical protein